MFIRYIPPEDGQQGPKHVAVEKIYMNKHHKELLRGEALLITLIIQDIYIYLLLKPLKRHCKLFK
jgi:hypothetical protein